MGVKTRKSQSKEKKHFKTNTEDGFVEQVTKYVMSPDLRKRFSEFPTRSDTNRAVQPQKMAKGLKFLI